MKLRSASSSALVSRALGLTLTWLVACSTDAGSPAAPGGAGSGPGGGSPAGAGATASGAAGSSSTGGGVSGAGGTPTSPAGAPGAGGGGTSAAGTGGTGSAGAAGAGVPSTMGVQADPGNEGDGSVPQPPPYNLTPASLGQLNNAPKGQLLGPTIYTQTGTYEGWDQWKFTYWVYVPAQYKPGHAAAIMILNDGLKYNGDQVATPSRFNTPTVFDNLIAEGSMPVTIGVFIDPGTDDGHHVGGGDGGRARQYDTPNDQYGKFLLTEFLPSEITSKYDIVSDADGWAIGGHSSGANASFIAAWSYPDTFHKVLAASATFGNTGGVFPGEILKGPAKPLRVYHMAGTNDDGGVYDSNNKAAMNLAQMGYHYRYRPGEDVHYPPAAAAADYPDALRWLWRGYSAGL